MPAYETDNKFIKYAAAAADSFAYSVSFGLESTITSGIVLGVVAGLIAWWGIRRKTVPTNIWE